MLYTYKTVIVFERMDLIHEKCTHITYLYILMRRRDEPEPVGTTLLQGAPKWKFSAKVHLLHHPLQIQETTLERTIMLLTFLLEIVTHLVPHSPCPRIVVQWNWSHTLPPEPAKSQEVFVKWAYTIAGTFLYVSGGNGKVIDP